MRSRVNILKQAWLDIHSYDYIEGNFLFFEICHDNILCVCVFHVLGGNVLMIMLFSLLC